MRRLAWASSRRRRSSTGRSRSCGTGCSGSRKTGPVAVALEDLHWADATSLQLLERLLPDTETSALLLVLTLRQERDHPAWRLKEDAARELPHRTTEMALEALSGDAGLDLLRSLVGEGTLPDDMEQRILEHADGNPFFLEELVRSLADSGSLVRDEDDWRFDHDVEVEIPPTVEKVILARIDRLDPQPHTRPDGGLGPRA